MESTGLTDNWGRGDPYEWYVGRWSRKIAPEFLSRLAVPSGRRWPDVGSGTGALCAAILDHCAPSSVAAVEPSEGFRNSAIERLGRNVAFHAGSATSIPLADASVDVTVSGLVLNFVPDGGAGLAEMARVTRPGGTIAAYVWDYAGKMELMRYFWDAAVQLNPAIATLDEGTRFSLCHPQALRDLLERAALRGIAVGAIDVETRFENFEDYWGPFLGGQGPAPAYAMSLDANTRVDLPDKIRERLPFDADGSLALTARAWAIHATVES